MFLGFGALWMACLLENTCTSDAVWDLNMPGPFCCAGLAGGGLNDDDDDDDAVVCEDLDVRLNANYGAQLDFIEATCNAAGGTWYEESYRVGCFVPADGIDCRLIMSDPRGVAASAACTAAGGYLHCDPFNFMCVCPGDNPWRNYDCDWMYDPFGGLRCNGDCDDSSKSCAQVDDACICALPPADDDDGDGIPNCGWIDAGEAGILCGGDCPDGQSCAVLPPGDICACFALPD